MSRAIHYPGIQPGCRVVAHWESAGGAYYLTLFKQSGSGYSYRAKGSGGYLGACGSDSAAVAALGDISRFQPDKNVTPMVRYE